MILSEERKVIASGKKGHSLCVILPAVWCKLRRIEKGDLVRLITSDNAVIILKNDMSANKIMKAFGLKGGKKDGHKRSIWE